MSAALILAQLLNGLQYGVLLFMLAAGLTLIFGIMSFVNLAHGAMYMFGAYFAATAYAHTGSFAAAVAAAIAGGVALGLVLELTVASKLYRRDHLDHVLATFGLVLFLNESARMIWGSQPLFLPVPAAFSGTVDLLGTSYSVYRLVIISVGIAVAVGAHALIRYTRLGMVIRAGSVNPQMVNALGVNIKKLNAILFCLGAGLAGLAGVMAAPILSVQVGMGEGMLIATLVVIVVGGIGSVNGALFAALIIGVVDTLGRAFLPMVLREMMSRDIATAAGPALASILVYVLMALILAFRPEGLFPAARQA
ncbi:MAG TPA: branched-chain amino acid ABC transporter permease [Ramlibacter sp.]|nr:branched-chain amino acid ABC transporter permease [Ramlibacter sp.]